MGHHLGDAGTSWLYVHNDILPKARKAMEKHRNIKVRNGFWFNFWITDVAYNGFPWWFMWFPLDLTNITSYYK